MKTPRKRLKIMQAAERLFTTRRFHEITMDDVAHGAGVGKGTIYFRDKDDLFFRTATAGFDELCELLERQAPREAPPIEQLAWAARQITAFFERRGQLFRMMQADDGYVLWCRGPIRQRWIEDRKRLVAAVAAILRKPADESLLRDDLPPDVLARFLLGMLRTRGRNLADASDDVRRPELVVDLFWNGARGCRGLTPAVGRLDAPRGRKSK